MRFATALVFFVFTATSTFALDPQSLVKDGWVYFKNGCFDKAAKTFESAARIDPANAEAFKGMGMSYMKSGYFENSTDTEMVEKAASAFQKAIQINSVMPDVRYQLGIAYLALNDKKGAESQYQALISMNKPLADELAGKIAAYKPQQNYRLIATYGNESSSGENVWGKCPPGQNWNPTTNTCATPPQITRHEAETTITSTPSGETRKRRRSGQEQNIKVRSEATTTNVGAINPHTGEFYAPAGSGYVGTRDGTYYAPAGPNGVINTRSGDFIPVQ